MALVVVPDYQLSLAIGREGQNVRLAARLTGWRLDIASEAEADEARERYLAERAERGSVEAVAEEAEEAGEADEAAPAVDFDPELLRKLEEFRRERLGGGEEVRHRTRPATLCVGCRRRFDQPQLARFVRTARRLDGRPTGGAAAATGTRRVSVLGRMRRARGEESAVPGACSLGRRIWVMERLDDDRP